VAFSADGRRMYLADTYAGKVFAYDVDPASGTLLDRHDLVTVRFGDGMCVDTSGRLWSAIWGGSAVHCYSADGALERAIELPARQPTSVCLADGALFVTTAAVGLDDPGPSEGAVLRLPIDASAPPATAFRLSR